jgi:sugar lactone lactonase YvrE
MKHSSSAAAAAVGSRHRAILLTAVLVIALVGLFGSAANAATTGASVEKIYWTDANFGGTATARISRADLDGSNVQPVVSPASLNDGYLAVDPVAGNIYWAAHTGGPGSPSIDRVDLYGGNEQTIISGPFGPLGVAVDAQDGSLFWTDSTLHKVQTSNLDGTSGITDLVVEPAVGYTGSPHDVAVDPEHGKIYWSSPAAGTIERANLDGTDREVVVYNLFAPEGIALDAGSGTLYFTAGGGYIYSVSTLLTDQNGWDLNRFAGGNPLGLAVDAPAGKLYWTSLYPGEIRRANLDGSDMETLVSGLDTPWGITLVALPPDDSPPTIDIPSGVTVDALSSSGATISYTASASDDVDPNPSLVCAPASASTFAVGDTTVHCTATDSSENTSTASFVVHVRGAAEQLTNLSAILDGFNLAKLGTSLHDKLVAAQGFLAANKSHQACASLADFYSQAQSQSGKGLTMSQASYLSGSASRITNVIGC